MFGRAFTATILFSSLLAGSEQPGHGYCNSAQQILTAKVARSTQSNAKNFFAHPANPCGLCG